MISFITGAIGKWLMIGGLGILTIAGAYGLGWARGSAAAEYKTKYAQAIADKQAAEQEIANFKKIIAAQDKLAAQHQKRVEADAEKLAELEEFIAGLPALDCPVPDDFLHSLPGGD